MKRLPRLNEGWVKPERGALSDGPPWQAAYSPSYPEEAYHVLASPRREVQWNLNIPVRRHLAAAYRLGSCIVAHPLVELPDDTDEGDYYVALPAIDEFSDVNLGVCEYGPTQFIAMDMDVPGVGIPKEEVWERFPGAIVLGEPFVL